MLKKTIFTTGIIFLSVVNAAPLKVNPEAVGNRGAKFLEQLDNTIGAYPRGLRNMEHSEFDVLQMSLILNQSANIERKLDILIAELQKTNRLLAQKK